MLISYSRKDSRSAYVFNTHGRELHRVRLFVYPPQLDPFPPVFTSLYSGSVKGLSRYSKSKAEFEINQSFKKCQHNKWSECLASDKWKSTNKLISGFSEGRFPLSANLPAVIFFLSGNSALTSAKFLSTLTSDKYENYFIFTAR